MGGKGKYYKGPKEKDRYTNVAKEMKRESEFRIQEAWPMGSEGVENEECM